MRESQTSIPAPADVPGDSPASVAIDLPCMTCGYNLRTLPTHAVCPECAAPVRTTLVAAAWRASVAPYLRDLRGAALAVGVLLLLPVVIGLDSSLGAGALTPMALAIVVPCSFLIGPLLTRPSGRPPGDPTNTLPRRLARWFLGGASVGLLVLVMCAPAPPAWAVLTLGGLAFIGAPVAIALHLGCVARWLKGITLARCMLWLAVGHAVVLSRTLLLLQGVNWNPLAIGGGALRTTAVFLLVVVAAWSASLFTFAHLVRKGLRWVPAETPFSHRAGTGESE